MEIPKVNKLYKILNLIYRKDIQQVEDFVKHLDDVKLENDLQALVLAKIISCWTLKHFEAFWALRPFSFQVTFNAIDMLFSNYETEEFDETGDILLFLEKYKFEGPRALSSHTILVLGLKNEVPLKRIFSSLTAYDIAGRLRILSSDAVHKFLGDDKELTLNDRITRCMYDISVHDMQALERHSKPLTKLDTGIFQLWEFAHQQDDFLVMQYLWQRAIELEIPEIIRIAEAMNSAAFSCAYPSTYHVAWIDSFLRYADEKALVLEGQLRDELEVWDSKKSTRTDGEGNTKRQRLSFTTQFQF